MSKEKAKALATEFIKTGSRTTLKRLYSELKLARGSVLYDAACLVYLGCNPVEVMPSHLPRLIDIELWSRDAFTDTPSFLKADGFVINFEKRCIELYRGTPDLKNRHKLHCEIQGTPAADLLAQSMSTYAWQTNMWRLVRSYHNGSYDPMELANLNAAISRLVESVPTAMPLDALNQMYLDVQGCHMGVFMAAFIIVYGDREGGLRAVRAMASEANAVCLEPLDSLCDQILSEAYLSTSNPQHQALINMAMGLINERH